MITQERLKELLQYDPNTGEFHRRMPRRGFCAGSMAGCVCCHSGYVRITVDRRAYNAHRLAWLYVHGKWPVNEVDHINHNRSDNRLSNLRQATGLENSRNKSRASNNTSGSTGVYWERGIEKWRVRLMGEGKLLSLGYYEDINAAILTAIVARFAYGYHSNHGK